MNIYSKYERLLIQSNFTIISFDKARPWGGFFVITEAQSQDFANKYFDGIDVSLLKIGGGLSPKILVIAPEKRLSWQYHLRRAEIWRVIEGKVGIKRSTNNIEGELEIFDLGDTITLQQGERHRLIGLDDYVVIAEIWQHTDANHPSDEDDIVRVQDDFGR